VDRRQLIVGVVVGALAGALAAPAQAAFPGAPGLLVFSSEGNIYTIAPDGSPPLSQLTSDGSSDHPRWSPDGGRIAFDRAGDIYVMDADGENVRRLTTFGGSSRPAWGPNGNRLVFVHRPNLNSGGDLWLVPVAGGAPSRLTFQGKLSCEVTEPSWSPLGGLIAYQWQRRTSDGNCGDTKVVIMRIDPRERTTIRYATDPDFTADGRGVFFSSSWDPEGDFFWPGDNLSWSGLRGGRRQMLTHLYCAEGDPCFISGAGSPDSAFPDAASFAYTFSRLGGTICVWTDADVGFCSNTIPVEPFAVDWQPV
jgi:dipeptidyl aminopeptidase/acylaminoacyl peptidase